MKMKVSLDISSYFTFIVEMIHYILTYKIWIPKIKTHPQSGQYKVSSNVYYSHCFKILHVFWIIHLHLQVAIVVEKVYNSAQFHSYYHYSLYSPSFCVVDFNWSTDFKVCYSANLVLMLQMSYVNVICHMSMSYLCQFLHMCYAVYLPFEC